jgi:tRNA-Thr(GGU) m(6)t(6)A37 methyltransferase TsaA
MARMELSCPLPAIGIVRTDRAELENTPIQAGLNRGEHGTLVIADAYREGFDGLADFDYAWLITWLHKPDGPEGDQSLKRVPFLLRSQRRPMGVFATRSPRRVNPVGLSLIRLLAVTGQTIKFAGVDLLDGTPVIDLKPYVTRFDRPSGEPRCGWFDRVVMKDGVTPEQLGRPESQA